MWSAVLIMNCRLKYRKTGVGVALEQSLQYWVVENSCGQKTDRIQHGPCLYPSVRYDGWRCVKRTDYCYVPEDIYPSISRYIINKADVFITVAGTIGRVGKIPDELDGANLTENADRLILAGVNQDWLIKVLPVRDDSRANCRGEQRRSATQTGNSQN